MLPRASVRIRSLRDIRVEHRPWRRFDEARELAIVLRGAEPAPVAKNVDVRALAEQRSLADAGKSRDRASGGMAYGASAARNRA